MRAICSIARAPILIRRSRSVANSQRTSWLVCGIADIIRHEMAKAELSSVLCLITNSNRKGPARGAMLSSSDIAIIGAGRMDCRRRRTSVRETSSIALLAIRCNFGWSTCQNACFSSRMDSRRRFMIPETTFTLRYYCEERNTACSHFNLSVPGLFFVGPAAVDSFGPPSPRLWREVTAKRLSNYLARTSRLAE
jgi:hypothetical protein